MIYREAVQIPSGQTKSVPFRQVIELTPGVIDNVQLTFPSGCAGLVGIRVKQSMFQLYPLTVGEWIVSDDFTIVYPENFPLKERPYALTLEGYNEDDTYPHTVHVQVSVRIPDDISAEILQTLQERIPVDLWQMVQSGVEIRKGSTASLTILREELIPLLRAVLDAQTNLVRLTVAGMSVDELARL
jgi:hypothetical protein